MTISIPTSLPVWNPAEAAGAGATFAGVLGALVVAVTFQIADGRVKAGTNARTPSLLVAPISLLLLLAAAYMYVVLSGTDYGSQQALTSCLPVPEGSFFHCDIAYLRISASMFCLGGSYLGAGAVALTYTLCLVARDNRKLTASSYSVSILVYATVVISSLALLWGYRDAQWALNGKRLGVTTFLLGQHRYVWVLGALVLALVLARLRSKLQDLITPVNGSGPVRLQLFLQILAGFFIVAYISTPFIWFLKVQDTSHTLKLTLNHSTISEQRPILSSHLTSFCLAWSALFIGMAFFANLLKDISGARAKSRKTSAPECDSATSSEQSFTSLVPVPHTGETRQPELEANPAAQTTRGVSSPTATSPDRHLDLKSQNQSLWPLIWQIVKILTNYVKRLSIAARGGVNRQTGG